MVFRVARKGQFETGSLVRVIALVCVLLALVMTGVEALHAHSDNLATGNSAPCAICLSAHAKAPVVAVHFLPEIFTVEALAPPYQSQGKSATADLSLFIRPPPAA